MALRKFFLALAWLIAAAGASAAEPAYPAFTVGNPKAATKLEFYMSPTCPMCAAAFRNSVLPLLARASETQDLLVRVAIMPRSEADIPFSRMLACVPQDKVLPYMTDWYFYRQRKDADMPALVRIGKKHGLLAETEAQCASKKNDLAMLAANNFVFTTHKLKETPAIFLNGKPLKETYYLWQLEEQLPTEAKK
jgi:protein-disulfide isomerase